MSANHARDDRAILAATTAAEPYARLEAIEAGLRAIVEAGRFTGELVLTFRDGCPTSAKRTSCHGDKDGWGFAVVETPDRT